jgi:hypothetical protein
MFARRRKSLTSTSASLPILPTANRQKSLKSFLEFQEQSKGIISAIITAKSSSHQTLGCIGVEENNGISEPSESCLHLPSPPIENDPQVYDLLAKDSAHFIHYGKSDNTVTSATVEKLIEKLTKEMGINMNSPFAYHDYIFICLHRL